VVYPVRGLDGVKYANRDGAVNVGRKERRGEGGVQRDVRAEMTQRWWWR